MIPSAKYVDHAKPDLRIVLSKGRARESWNERVSASQTSCRLGK